MLVQHFACSSHAILFDRAFRFGAAKSDAIRVGLLGCTLSCSAFFKSVQVDEFTQLGLPLLTGTACSITFNFIFLLRVNWG
ncbi:MAG: hypothetical protein BGP05_01235 [Rhizobiales bacterium 62-47]|nr:MAG: hypothetical protein BGP05_01235 [Rhizobiales bacterium 62-47]